MEDLLGVFFVLCLIFWAIQIINVIFTEIKYFENHTHKLMWFAAIFVSFIIGAIWYVVWKNERKQILSRKVQVSDIDKKNKALLREEMVKDIDEYFKSQALAETE